MSYAEKVEITITKERAEELKETSKITSLPVEGIHLLDVMDESLELGLINKDDMISGQRLLIAIAEKLEYEGDDPEIRAELVDSIKLMSNYATTRLVPIRIPAPLE